VSTAVIVDYIDEHRAKHGVEPICEVLTEAGTQIAPSTYYAAKTRAPSARSVTDAATTKVLTQVHAENYGVYGVPRTSNEHSRLPRRKTCTRMTQSGPLRGLS
jgi:putative transposase